MKSFTTPEFADAEEPQRAGNQLYLLNAPSPENSLQLFRNGLLQVRGVDYISTAHVIKLLTDPDNQDVFLCFYRF